MKKRIWVEGSVAGELTVEDRDPDGTGFEADGAADWEEEVWRCDYEEELEFFGDGDVEEVDLEGDADGAGAGVGEPGCSMHGKELGRFGEKVAVRYLEKNGYEVVERNYTCPLGEADIVAMDGSTIVFVEVKTRSGVRRGFPSEAVDARKQTRYERIAGWYLASYGGQDATVRFDVVAIMAVGEQRAFLKHYVNAFGTGF